MKKIKTLLLAMAALLCCTATMAYDFKADNICYLITSEEDLTVSVTYQGSTFMLDNNYSGSLTIPSTVTNDGKTYNVTSITSGAFFGCKDITDITIPASITRIETLSFSGCSGIKSIVLPDSLAYVGARAFNGCSSLKDITFPHNNSINIDSYAFEGTAWLNEQPDGILYIGNILYCYKGEIASDTTIVIADGTTSILSYAFSSSRTTAENIKEIVIPNSVTTIGAYAFQNCNSIESITIPDKVAAIESYTFAGCYSLEEVTLGSSVKSIGNYAFQECSALESITLGKNMKSVGKKAFTDCYCLENIVVEGVLEYIGEDAFNSTSWYDSQQEGVIYLDKILYGYKGDIPEGATIDVKEGTVTITSNAFKSTSIKAITLPSSLKIIGDYAFQKCTNLGNVTLPSGLTSIGNYAFSGCTGITEMTLPDSLSKLGNYAFSECTNLEQIELGKGITSIGNYAFKNCTKILEVNIPDNITKIGTYAFQNCKINTITFGKGTREFDSFVFYNCTSIVNLYLMSETPPSVSGGLFSSSGHYRNGTLYVPKGTIEAYKAHETWGKFQYIEEHELTGIGDTEAEMPAIRTTAGGIMLTGADGKEVRVYDITGAAIGTVDDYAGETIMLDKGIYIVRVGNKAMKVRL